MPPDNFATTATATTTIETKSDVLMIFLLDFCVIQKKNLQQADWNM